MLRLLPADLLVRRDRDSGRPRVAVSSSKVGDAAAPHTVETSAIGSSSSRQVRVLVIPADERLECGVQAVAADGGDVDRRVAGLLIGGQVQAAYHWRLYGQVVPPRTVRVYLDGDRVLRGLPGNGRAAALGARLGHTDRTMWLLGPALVVGAGLGGADVDVPDAVVFAAWRAGLLLTPTGGPYRAIRAGRPTS